LAPYFSIQKIGTIFSTQVSEMAEPIQCVSV